MVTLSPRDWSEIYYALQSKLAALEKGAYGEGDVDCDIEKWKLHLGSIIEIIGDDAEHAIKLGIAPVQTTTKPNTQEDCCPECGSDDITGSGTTETDGHHYWTDPSCNKCGSRWRQTYVLSFEGSEILEKGEKHKNDIAERISRYLGNRTFCRESDRNGHGSSPHTKNPDSQATFFTVLNKETEEKTAVDLDNLTDGQDGDHGDKTEI